MKTFAVERSTLANEIGGRVEALLFSVSYEERSPVIWRALEKSGLSFHGIFNANHHYLKENVDVARTELPNLGLVELNSDDPLASFDKLRGFVSRVFTKPVKLGVDITCFTREALAMLLVVLQHSLPRGSTLSCLYTPAGDYTPSVQNKVRDGWLSRGIMDVRSVLGYRGHVSLLAATHLIVLPGFENERAQFIIDTLQPERLTIGHPTENLRPEFAERATKMTERLRACYSKDELNTVCFSAKDPFKTRDLLLDLINEKENTVLACLNTKVAMAGACMAALAKSCVQLIYAQPLQYNIKDFATAGATTLIFEFDLVTKFAPPNLPG